MEVMDLFLKEMELQGLVFDGVDLPIRMDGKTRYVKVSGRSRRKTHHRSGWYIGHLGDFPVGKFGWMHGDNPTFSWSLYEYMKDRNGGKIEYVTLSPEELEKERLEKERQRKLQLIEERNRYNFSKALATLEYYRSLPLRPHPYLHIKKINIAECSSDVRIYNQTPYTRDEIKTILGEHFPEYVTESNIRKLLDYQTQEISYRGFNLLIVGRNIDDEILMFQLIFDKKSKKTDKNKHFPKGLIKQNTFHTIGAKITAKTKKVLLCEGWATGISLFRLTKGRIPIVIAWDSGNMNSVAKVLRKHAYDCDIYSANDNDHTKPPQKNAGILGGLKTGNAVGAYMLNPRFDSSDENQENWSDWNDIDLNYDFQSAQSMLVEQFKNAEYIPAQYLENVELLSEGSYFNDFEFLDFDLSTVNQIEFNLNWITLIKLISRGLMSCNYTVEEQLALYKKEHLITQEKYIDLAPSFLREYDYGIDKKINQIFFQFNIELQRSTKHILMNDDLFIPVIKELMKFQHYTSQNLLQIYKDQISMHRDPELSEAIFHMYLKKSAVFRDTSQWRQDITVRFREKYPNDIEVGLFYHIITMQSEYQYWEVVSKKEREEKAVDEMIRIYENNLEEFSKLNTICMNIHYSKLPYIYGAANKAILLNSKENQSLLTKLIDRLSATNGIKLDLKDFINEPIS